MTSKQSNGSAGFVSAEAFTSPTRSTVDVALPSGRGKVKVRELSRGETNAAWKESEDETLKGEMGDAAFDFAFFRRGLVEPVISEDQMRTAWDAQRPDDAQAIVMAILKESGIAPGFPEGD